MGSDKYEVRPRHGSKERGDLPRNDEERRGGLDAFGSVLTFGCPALALVAAVAWVALGLLVFVRIVPLLRAPANRILMWAVAFRFEVLTLRTFLVVLGLCVGLLLASEGETDFSWKGLLMILGASCLSGLR